MRTVFSDDNGNEMDCYLNDKGKVFINVGKTAEDNIYSGFITLDKQDVSQLIKMLSELEEQMED